MSEYREAFKDVVKNIGFMLGFRTAYRVENLLTGLAVLAFVLAWYIWGLNHIYTILVTGPLLVSPSIVQYIAYKWKRVVRPTVPIFTVIVSAILSAFLPPLIIPALINVLFIEDITIFAANVDIVKFKRNIRILIEPIAKREFFLLSAINIGSSILSFMVTGNPIVFIYAFIGYGMLVYSIIFVPPHYRSELGGRGVLEEFSRRIPFLYFLFIRFYYKPSIRRLSKEAGYIGVSYDHFIRRMGGLFTLSIYGSLAFTPLLYIFIGDIAFFIPLIVAPVMYGLPYLVLKRRRAARAGKISRNLILILSYLAAMKSVHESFTNIMMNLRTQPNLAKMFGLTEESKIYLNIFSTTGIESTAVRLYADTIPDDFFRDVVRTMMDIEENEGSGQVFRMLVRRLRDFTGRYIDRISTTFENVGGNVISVIMIVETSIPILMFMSAPTTMPFIFLLGGLLGSFMIMGISTMVLPDIPSEYIYSKQRFRRAGAVFTTVATVLTIMEYAMFPEYITYITFLNIPVAFFVALWYTSLYDMKLNSDLLNKFPDLLVLFSSSMSRYNNVEKSLLELAEQGTFTDRMRAEFRRMANMFAVLNVQRLPYRGVYWYKYFLFLVSISAIYGTTPRELYSVISEFMVEYKRFFSLVASFGKNLMFLTFIALFIMTIEYSITTQFLEVMKETGVEEMASQMGIQTPFPILSDEELARQHKLSTLALLMVAILNGVALAKAVSGTYRDGKWVLILFVAELILLYLARTTGLGISIAPPGATS